MRRAVYQRYLDVSVTYLETQNESIAIRVISHLMMATGECCCFVL